MISQTPSMCSAVLLLLAALGSAPALADTVPERGSDRKDGLAGVIAAAPDAGATVDAHTAELYAALSAAKQAGDEAAVRSLHVALGWEPRPATTSVDVTAQCPRVLRSGARDGSRRWQEDVRVSDPDWPSGRPAMYAEQNGRIWVVAEDLVLNYLDIYFSDDGGVNWTYDYSLGGAEDLSSPSIVVGQGNTKRLLIAYEYGRTTPNSAIRLYWEDLATQQYATVAIETGLLVANPQVCADCPETCYWYPYLTYVRGTIGLREDASDVIFTRSLDYGTSWDPPQVIASGTTRDNAPDIDFGAGRLYLAYTRTYAGSDHDIYVRRSTNFGGSWEAEQTLGYSAADEYTPRVAAAYSSGAAVVAYVWQYVAGESFIDCYYTTNQGQSWQFAMLPSPSGGGLSTGIDLCASFHEGSIHAAYHNAGHVYFTKADPADPSSWSSLEIVNDIGLAAPDDRVAVAANPARTVDECVAWTDERQGPSNRQIFFDAGYHLGDYLIVDGPGNLAEELAPLIAWKESIGYAVKYVTRAQILAAYPSGDDGERIRAYLRDRRASTRYVLLVGKIAQIPMRILYPDGNPGDGLGYGSDYYYAQLTTTNWDLDGDNRWGEFGQDALDIHPDVFVGRIPFDTEAEVASLAQNTVAYEQATGAWKRNVLLAHGFMNHLQHNGPETDCAWVAVHVREDFLDTHGWTHTTLFERGGLNPSDPTSTAALSQTNFELYSGLQQQGVINCMAHGNTQAMRSNQWATDYLGNGIVDISQEYAANDFSLRYRIALDPVSALVFLCGCHTGVLFGKEPDFATSDLRSRYLFTVQHSATAMLRFLETGAVGVIGASAGSDYQGGWTQPNDGGQQSLNYYFFSHLVGAGQRAGDAFHGAMLDFATVHGLQRGIRDFNYFGDPSLEVEGVAQRRWRSSGFGPGATGTQLAALGAAGRAGSQAQSPDLQQSDPEALAGRDEDTTIWWEAGEIDNTRMAGAFLGASDGSLYAGVDLNADGSPWEGCVYRTVDDGETWLPTGALPDSRSVTCLAQTQAGTLIAGGLAFSGEMFRAAIYRSLDHGVSWTLVHSFPDGMVHGLMLDAGGRLWAATGPQGEVYVSTDDGAHWTLHSSLGADVHVNAIMQASSGRIFVACAGNIPSKVLWSEGGGPWQPATGLSAATGGYALIEFCGELFAGVSGQEGRLTYRSDLRGEIWEPNGPVPDERLDSVRAFCVAPGCHLLAGGSRPPGQSFSYVLAWDTHAEEWFTFGGALDAATEVHALHATPTVLVAGTGDDYGKIYVHVLPTASGIGETPPALSEALRVSVASPALNAAEFRFSGPGASPASVMIFDMTGRLVRTLSDTAPCGSAEHTLTWDGRDGQGQSVPAGVYSYRLTTGSRAATGRFVLLR